MTGANAAGPSDRYGWFRGQNHDYLLALPSGRVIAEATINPDRYNIDNDRLWVIILDIHKQVPGQAPVMPNEFFITRTAARARIEEYYSQTPDQLQ